MNEINKHLKAKFLSKYKVADPFFKGLKPMTLEVHPSYICNYNCEFCIDKWLRNVPSEDGLQINSDCRSMMTHQNATDIIQGCVDLGIKGIILSGGGDPPINPETLYLVEWGKKQGIKSGMFTNGYALTDRNIPRYIEALEWLRFSFDSFDAKNYAKTKGVIEQAYYKVLENIKKCVDYKNEHNLTCNIGIDFIIQPHNIELIQDIYTKSSELGVDYVQYCDCVIPGYQFTDKTKHKILDEINRCFITREDTYLKEGIYPPKAVYEPVQSENETNCADCRMKEYIFQVGADGGVRVCPHLARHDDKMYGNINEKSLKEIWENREREIDPYLWEHCRFREQNKLLDGLNNIEHIEFL